MYPIFGWPKFGKKDGVTGELLFGSKMPRSRKPLEIFCVISDDSKACGQHLWFWRSTGVAVQVGLHLSPVFLLEGVRNLKWKAAPSRKSHSIQTPRIPDQGQWKDVVIVQHTKLMRRLDPKQSGLPGRCCRAWWFWILEQHLLSCHWLPHTILI